jgi:hypothetical protein
MTIIGMPRKPVRGVYGISLVLAVGAVLVAAFYLVTR